MEEDIFHEMRGNDKHYEACFYQVVADSSPISEDLSELGEQYIEDYGYPYLYDEDSLVQQDSMIVRQREDLNRLLNGLLPYLTSYDTDRFSKYANDFFMQLYSMPEDERCRAAMTMIKDLCSVFENRKVWFTINGFVDNYYISMYYDNGYNEASGEDL